jgi:hypothetical protein
MNNYQVIDSRNGRVQGPFSLADAMQLAASLNDFVLRNAGITTNPFHAGRGWPVRV